MFRHGSGSAETSQPLKTEWWCGVMRSVWLPQVDVGRRGLRTTQGCFNPYRAPYTRSVANRKRRPLQTSPCGPQQHQARRSAERNTSWTASRPTIGPYRTRLRRQGPCHRTRRLSHRGAFGPVLAASICSFFAWGLYYGPFSFVVSNRHNGASGIDTSSASWPRPKG